MQCVGVVELDVYNKEHKGTRGCTCWSVVYEGCSEGSDIPRHDFNIIRKRGRRSVGSN